jgi:hypothetical protein
MKWKRCIFGIYTNSHAAGESGVRKFSRNKTLEGASCIFGRATARAFGDFDKGIDSSGRDCGVMECA